jgi:N-acetylmuramoyl-L-alanine amidase
MAVTVLGFGAVLVSAWRGRTEHAVAQARARTSEPLPEARWPHEAAALQVQRAEPKPGFAPRKVVVDPGHGAEGNKGNVSSLCEDEQDFTLRVGRHLVESLRASGWFEARLSRDGAPVAYAERVRAAERWGAEAFISLHSDVRGAASPWSPSAGLECLRADEGSGFALLVSDEGAEPMVQRRRGLAASLGTRLLAAGFVPYPGEEYTQAYEPLESAGGFVDRHAPGKRIFVLRTEAMPAVLVETHNALFPAEVLRWQQDGTLEAFDAAVVSALVDYFSG